MSFESASTARFRRHRGFTFVELMIASALLAIVAVGVAAAMVQTPRLSRMSREEAVIRSAMRAVVAEISAAPFSQVPGTYQGFSFDVDGIEAPKGDEDGLPGAVDVKVVGEAAATYYVVTLSVDWRGVLGIRSLRTVHYLANVRGDTEVPSETPGDESGTTDPNVAEDGSGTWEEDPVTPVEDVTEGDY